MKTNKIILGLGLGISLLGNFAAHAQSGLEGIIVEKYYKSNAADAADATDPVPLNSTTYRIYVDLADGYQLQAVYGDVNHKLKINTTTTFWNNQNFDAYKGTNTASQLKNSTIALDSWITLGGAASGNNIGVLKSEDNGAANLITNNGAGHVPSTELANAPASIGIPLTTQDGMKAFTSTPAITIAGMDLLLQRAFFPSNTTSPDTAGFETNDGAWATSGLDTGATASNKVLIAQLTTNGALSFLLNLQLKNITTNAVENWVSSSPLSGEFTMAALTGSNIGAPPTVSITSPANGANFFVNNPVAIAATAADDGAVTSVDFYLNGALQGSDATAPYTFTVTPSTAGTYSLTAIATDNDGNTTTSSVVTINETVAVNVALTVSITSPANGASFFTGNPVAIAATAADADGTVTTVGFYLNGVLQGSDVTAPYTFTVTPATAGTYSLTARATDNGGAITTSSIVTIIVADNIAPTVSITAPANGAVIAGAIGAGSTTITITANAADSDGTVDSVEFFVGAVKKGVDLTSPYSFNWVSSGVYGAQSLTARASDHNNGHTISAPVNITITNPNAKPYFVDNTDSTCVLTGFSMPIKARNAVVNVIGFDMVLRYNKTKVTPTGVVTAGTLVNPSYVTIANSIDATAGSISISVSLNNAAPNNTFFSGIGQLISVAFNKTASFGSTDTALFTIDSITESRYTGVSNIMVDPGKHITHADSTFHGSLVFWADNSGIQGGVGTLPTSVAATYSLAPVVNPDVAGNFSYVVKQSALSSLHFNITRAITNTVSVQSVVNGFDALLAKKVVMKDASFVPSVYQVLAMDVNQDGKISAGDVSQMNQRSVLLIPEFKQAWNYNADGTPNGAGPSRDWVFIDGSTLSANYLISNVYPAADGTGYTRDNVPVPATSIAVSVTNSGGCSVIDNKIFTGLMLGDVNGNYKDIPVDGVLRSADSSKIVFDLSKAIIANGYATIPVSVVSGKAVNAIDFAVQFINGVTYQSISNTLSGVDGLGNFNAADSTLRFTSNSIQNYDVTQPVTFVVVAANNGQIRTSDLTSTEGYVNGNPASVEVKGGLSNNNVATFPNTVNVFPNPVGATEVLNVLVIADATVELVDINGSLILSTTVKANQNLAISTQGIAAGVYTVKVYNDTLISNQKVVIIK